MSTIVTIPAGSCVVDYSWARPDPVALAAAGVRAVARYLARTPSGKVLTVAEAAALHAAGIGILLVHEQSAAGFTDPTLGEDHGALARRQADELGYPTGLPIFFAGDTDTRPAQWPAVELYARRFAAAAAPYPIGGYVEAGLANHLVDAGLIGPVWAPSATGWNAGVAYRRCDLRQHYGHREWPALAPFGDSIDSNTALTAMRVWLPHTDAAQIDPFPAHPEEIPMAGRTLMAKIVDPDRTRPDRDAWYWLIADERGIRIIGMNGAKIPAAAGGWSIGEADGSPYALLDFPPAGQVLELDHKHDVGGNYIGPQIHCSDGGDLVLPVAGA